ncbi:MAG: FAD-dependent oxidoreductase [Myxococcota bacterium]
MAERLRIAVLGAGPIGLEAAAEAVGRRHEVVVFEAGEIGAHVRRWGHVPLFTPWRMAVTDRGLARSGATIADPDGYPTGDELVARYLEPLAGSLDVRTHHRVVDISRAHRTKGQDIGSIRRAEEPFRLVVAGPDDERIERADAVLDCTGVLGDPAPAGAGGVPALGERALRETDVVRYGPLPVDDLAGRRVALIGDGASAVTVLDGLLRLSPAPQVLWITPSATVPGFVSPADDVLPARKALYELGRSAPGHPAVTHRPGALVDGMARTDAGLRLTLDDGSAHDVDVALVCTGFRPDHALSRELQLHLCYASEGPMKLAAALLAASGGGGDCLAQPEQDAAVLANPEPRFFVLGNKSYGRRSDFLLRIGHQQVRDALDLLG